jgi:diadenylate cyclase
MNITLSDVLDVAIMSLVFYKSFMLLRGTRAAPMVIGLVVLLVVAVVAQRAELAGIDWLLTQVKTVWLIGLVIVFQNELRRALTFIGQSRIFRPFISGAPDKTIGEVLTAVRALTRQGIGALIVLTREVGIAPIIDSGRRLDAEVSAPLLVSLFQPKTPLHDGGVVINGDRIEAAACILPLTQNPIDPRLGTRHRAAVGLSEESDALIVVVSEETSSISIAHDGHLERNVTPDGLREFLTREMRRGPLVAFA